MYSYRTLPKTWTTGASTAPGQVPCHHANTRSARSSPTRLPRPGVKNARGRALPPVLPLFGISFRRARSRRAWERAGFARPVPSAPCDRSLACPRSAAPSLVPQSNRNAPSGQRGPRPAEQSPLPTTPKGEAASGRKRLVRASCSCSPEQTRPAR